MSGLELGAHLPRAMRISFGYPDRDTGLKIGEPVVIATLLPVDSRSWTEHSFLHPHNKAFYLRPLNRLNGGPSSIDTHRTPSLGAGYSKLSYCRTIIRLELRTLPCPTGKEFKGRGD